MRTTLKKNCTFCIEELKGEKNKKSEFLALHESLHLKDDIWNILKTTQKKSLT